MASPVNENGKASIPMSSADRERALEIVYMLMAEPNVDPKDFHAICSLFHVASTCKAASAIITPRIKATFTHIREKVNEEFRLMREELRLRREEHAAERKAFIQERATADFERFDGDVSFETWEEWWGMYFDEHYSD